MKVSFYIARPTITLADGKQQSNPNPTAIFCRISYEGYELKYFTPENILPKFWNGKAKPHRAKETTKFPEYPEFNKRLDNIETAIKNTIRKYTNENSNKPPTPEVLKPLLDIAIRDNGNVIRVTFLSFFDEFIKHCREGIRKTKKGKPITPGTIKSYVTTKAVIESYQTDTNKKVDFASIDMLFYTDFIKYLTLTAQQSTNYIAKHIKVIKSVLNYATDTLHINTNTGYKSSGFMAITEETDSIYLPEHELKEIAGRDLSNNPSLDRVRDLFLIGCCTGLRFSDLSALRPENIKDGYITIKQIKTGKPVVIPVDEVVERIMNKYSGLLPEALSNQKMNEALKEIAKECESLKKKVSITYTKGGATVKKGADEETETPEKWKLVSTHTARRSFATNMYMKGIGSITIMAITGHKTESAFMKYIKVPAVEHAKIMKLGVDKYKAEKSKTIAI